MKNLWRSLASLAASILALALLAACGSGGGGGSTPPPPSSKLVVVPSAVSVEAEQTVRLQASVAGVTDPVFTYTLQAPAGVAATDVATRFGVLSPNGSFTAAANARPGLRGSIVVRETRRNVSATVPVVIVPFVKQVVVTPTSASVLAGQTQTFTVVPFDINGNPIPDFVVDWRVTGGIGTITPAGLFTGTNAGSGTVTAKIGDAAAVSVPVTVVGSVVGLAIQPAGNPILVEAGVRRQFRAVVRDAAGRETEVKATWTVSEAVGTISAAGLFTATKTVGATGTLTATYQTQKLSLPIRIVPLVPPPGLPANVKGRVDQGGQPASNVKVEAFASGQTTATASGTTGSDGEYYFWLPAGSYEIVATKGSAVVKRVANLLSADDVRVVNFVLP
ncbi:MAG TPA: hypothetical protein DCZ72_07755 [Armatimonadetes bacterium]|nr:hypothetical protein [Armatimonadota bacterium]